MARLEDFSNRIDQCLQNIEWMEAQLSLLKITKFTQAKPFLDQIGINWSRVRRLMQELNSNGYRYRRSRTFYISKPEILSKVWNYPEMVK